MIRVHATAARNIKSAAAKADWGWGASGAIWWQAMLVALNMALKQPPV
jgi:hypothetical protein